MKNKLTIAMIAMLAVAGMVGCGGRKDTSNSASTDSKEVIRVTSVSVTPKRATVYLNDESATIQLNVKVLPENAENKNVRYTSSDPATVSVDDSGKVTGLKLGTATITVTSVDGNVTDTATITVKQDRSQDNDITELVKPSFLANYEKHTAKLEKVDNISKAASADLTAYYENEQGTKDFYKVGNQNDFRFQVSAKSIDDNLIERTIANPYTTVKLELWDGETNKYVAISEGELSNHVSINPSNNRFKFTETAAGKRYKLTVSVDKTKYANVASTVDDVELEFEVFNGYNVYSKEELSIFDNVNNEAWAAIKEANNLKDINAKGIALHTDLSINNEDIPANFKYSAQDVATYKQTFASDFDSWYTKKKEHRPTEAERNSFSKEDATNMLVDSLKDWTTVYNRYTTPEENFQFEGNYFTVDASKIKQIFVFGENSLTEGDVSTEYIPDSETEGSNGSHGQLFGINTENYSTNGGGCLSFKNMSLIGNGDLSNNDDYLGGLITIKTKSAKLDIQNFLTSKSFISFLTEKEDKREGTVKTETYFDRCKNFDSYNSLLYIWGSDVNVITNSYMAHAGGAIALLDDVHANEKNNPEKQDSNFGAPHVDCYNVYFSNPVVGTEPWFVAHKATALVTQMAGFGHELGWLGRNAKAHGQHMNISGDNGKGQSAVDLIAIDICGAAPLTNSLQTGGSMLEGTFKIYSDAELTTLYAGLDMKKNAQTDPTSQAGMVTGAVTAYQAGNVLPLYRLMAASAGSPAIVAESNAGGHGMLYAADGSNGVIGFINYPNYSATPLNGNQTVIAEGVEIDPVPFFNGETELGYMLAAENMDKLASGEYLSLYLQPGDAKYEFLGAFIKMAKVA